MLEHAYNMLYTLLSCLGLTYILKYGTILSPVRCGLVARAIFFKQLFECSLCLGFWSGVIIAPWTALNVGPYDAILLPFASAAWCWSCDELHEFVVATRDRFKR